MSEHQPQPLPTSQDVDRIEAKLRAALASEPWAKMFLLVMVKPGGDKRAAFTTITNLLPVDVVNVCKGIADAYQSGKAVDPPSAN